MKSDTIPHLSPTEYRKRWLLLQLQPEMVHAESIFDHLSTLLSGASMTYVNTQTHKLLGRIREYFDSDTAPESPQTPIFCAFDEAEHAGTFDQNGERQPILREIIHAWAKTDVFMVVAGTRISQDLVEKVMASGVVQRSGYRLCWDTGAFDTAKAQRQYLEKYLPQSFMRTECGKRLLERTWYWLHGRWVRALEF